MLNLQPTGFIYRIVCTKTGQNYIGQTVNTQQRWAQHIADLRKGKHHSHKLQDVFWKYGQSCLQFEVIETGVETADLLNREAHWMKEHEGYTKGFNIQYVGHKNGKPSIPVQPRKVNPPPPLTIVGAAIPQPAPAPINDEAHKMLDEVREHIIELSIKGRGWFEEAQRLRTENEKLLRENGALRWRLGERGNEDRQIA